MARLCIQKNTKIIFVSVRETMMVWINISKHVNWCIKHVYLFHLNKENWILPSQEIFNPLR